MAVAEAAPGRLIGAPVRRKEDARLVTGTGTYVDDIRLPGMVHMALVRSPHAHARIRAIRSERARAMQGVLMVLTGAELTRHAGPLPVGWSLPGLKVPKKYALAVDRVRYVGEAVAAVVAEDPYTARDAADAVEVEYEPLPAVVDPERAAAGEGPVIWEDLGSNVAFTWSLKGGDVERAFAEAEHTLHARFVQQRLAPVAIEPRGCIAQYRPFTGELTLWSATQIPHLVHLVLPGVVGLPETKVRVVAPEVGGGFGSKLNFYAEEVLVAVLARLLGRPVKWIESRSENFLATIQGRGQIQDVEVAFRRDGTITGLRLKIYADLGAHHQLLTPAIPTFTPFMMCGVYKIPHVQAEVVGVFTNKTPTDAYRGAGRPEATFLIERVVDLVARRCGIDPAEVRRRNFVPREAFPYTTSTGVQYDSGDYARTLERLLQLVDYDRFREEQRRARQQGRLIGIGFSTYVEICGLAPSRIWGALGAGIGGWESATVRVSPFGKVTVLTGTSPHGQGHETAWAQIVADLLGVPFEDIEVLHGDTAVAPHGLDTYGSRSAAVGGAAVFVAARRVREKARRIAAHLLEVSPDDVEFAVDEGGGRFHVRGAPGRSVGFRDVALAAYTSHNLPEGEEPGLDATVFYDPSNFTFPFGAHACVVEVDPESGKVRILRYVAVDDCGKVINPLLVEGQVHGGIAQGIGQALFEEMVYDRDGQPLSASLADYAVPTAAELPAFETARTETPSPVNPLGVKGVGEAGTIAAPAAVVNAVVDALAHLGIDHVDMPLKPEKIWRAIRAAREGRKAS